MAHLRESNLGFPSASASTTSLVKDVSIMASPGHQVDHSPGMSESNTGDKLTLRHVSDDSFANGVGQDRSREAPPMIKVMTDEERYRAELALVRKIDIRLMPMAILIYIMNYLDRNNIAAARLAGLQTELKLTSTQYSVGAGQQWA